MSEKGHELELSDEQREEVRKMLEKFGAKKKKQASQQQAQKRPTTCRSRSIRVFSTWFYDKWHQLTPKTRRYQFVRESRALVPYILDNILLSREKLDAMIYSAGMDVTSQNASLTVCAIDRRSHSRISDSNDTGGQWCSHKDYTIYCLISLRGSGTAIIKCTTPEAAIANAANIHPIGLSYWVYQ